MKGRKGRPNKTYKYGHKAAGSPEYILWKNIRARCGNPKVTSYERYGARGIKVCARWNDFGLFFADMGPRPSPSHSIEREDNNGDYCPENCRWATATEQARNRRSSTILTHNGEAMTLIEWSHKLGISASTICQRISHGWTVDRALSTPLRGL